MRIPMHNGPTVTRNALSERTRGFTLIEMAIVLVVIGLVIGAVLKGQDLIQNCRAKRFANFIRQAELTQHSHFDRNGKYALQTTGLSSQFPTFANSTTIGSSTYYVAFGQNGTRSSIVVTTYTGTGLSAGSPTPFTSSDLLYAKSFDAAMDQRVDGSSGRVQALVMPTFIADNGTAIAAKGTSLGWETTVFGLIYDF
jgi:prepilin-type N-terminal cleavage/methylation domain-containing protein